MMKDDVLNMFVEKIVSEDIDNEAFEQHIDMFSRFLSYTNSDYKYNGTYLGQYIDDFITTIHKLKMKNEKYNEIFMALVGLGYGFEVLIDQVFFASFSLRTEIEREYIGLIKEKIMSKKIEMRITLISDEKEYVFCKEYSDFEDEKLIENIRKDIKKYIRVKKIRRSNDAIA